MTKKHTGNTQPALSELATGGHAFGRHSPDFHAKRQHKQHPSKSMKIAISIISDPKAGEEALARVFNALSRSGKSGSRRSG